MHQDGLLISVNVELDDITISVSVQQFVSWWHKDGKRWKVIKNILKPSRLYFPNF